MRFDITKPAFLAVSVSLEETFFNVSEKRSPVMVCTILSGEIGLSVEVMFLTIEGSATGNKDHCTTYLLVFMNVTVVFVFSCSWL